MHRDVLEGSQAFLGVFVLFDQTPPGHHQVFIAKGSELNVRMIFAEFIYGLSCEMAFNKMITISKPNERDVIMYVNSHRFFQFRGNLIEIEISINKCSY